MRRAPSATAGGWAAGGPGGDRAGQGGTGGAVRGEGQDDVIGCPPWVTMNSVQLAGSLHPFYFSRYVAAAQLRKLYVVYAPIWLARVEPPSTSEHNNASVVRRYTIRWLDTGDRGSTQEVEMEDLCLLDARPLSAHPQFHALTAALRRQEGRRQQVRALLRCAVRCAMLRCAYACAVARVFLRAGVLLGSSGHGAARASAGWGRLGSQLQVRPSPACKREAQPHGYVAMGPHPAGPGP